MLLFVLSACQKNLSSKDNVLHEQTMAKSSIQRALVYPDIYKISSITQQYNTNSVKPYDAAQIAFTYNADGSFNNITRVQTTKTKKSASSDSVVTSINSTTLNYAYKGDTTIVERVQRNSTGQVVNTLRLQYIKDSTGRVIRRTRQLTLPTGQMSAMLSEQFGYDNNNQLVSNTSSSSTSAGSATYTYNWLNGNLMSYVTPTIDQYTYDTDHAGQPGDLCLLNDQLTVGFAVPTSANVTTSDLQYINGSNQFQGGTKYTYTYDNKGRISSGVSLDVPYYAPQTATVLSTTYINYLNN